jgi:hypothetical protein
MHKIRHPMFNLHAMLVAAKMFISLAHFSKLRTIGQ